MLSPEAAGTVISEQTHLSKDALLSLASLLSVRAGEDHGHDNLLPAAVDECIRCGLWRSHLPLLKLPGTGWKVPAR